MLSKQTHVRLARVQHSAEVGRIRPGTLVWSIRSGEVPRLVPVLEVRSRKCDFSHYESRTAETIGRGISHYLSERLMLCISTEAYDGHIFSGIGKGPVLVLHDSWGEPIEFPRNGKLRRIASNHSTGWGYELVAECGPARAYVAGGLVIPFAAPG